MLKVSITLAILITSLLSTVPAEAQIFRTRNYTYNPSRNGGVRYCNNPGCSMCNQIWGPMGSTKRVVTPTPVTVVSQVQTRSLLSAMTVKPRTVVVPAPIVVQETVVAERRATGTELHPTPQEVVDQIWDRIKLSSSDVLYDLGCGDARVLIGAVDRYNVEAVGIEINPNTVKVAQTNVDNSLYENQIRIVEGDVRLANLSTATVVFLYLYPDLMEEVLPRIPSDTIIVSYSHKIPNHPNRTLVDNVYVAIKE